MGIQTGNLVEWGEQQGTSKGEHQESISESIERINRT